MIKMASFEDIDNLAVLRIALLNEVRNYDENYDWSEYLKSLKDYYAYALLNGNAVAFLAYENDKAIAMVVMCFYNIIPLVNNLDGKMALLTDMYTAYEYRNQGIGTKLLEEIMKYAKHMGCMRVTLNATNLGRKLYEKYGFKDISGEMDYKFI